MNFLRSARSIGFVKSTRRRCTACTCCARRKCSCSARDVRTPRRYRNWSCSTWPPSLRATNRCEADWTGGEPLAPSTAAACRSATTRTMPTITPTTLLAKVYIFMRSMMTERGYLLPVYLGALGDSRGLPSSNIRQYVTNNIIINNKLRVVFYLP